jgi:hypothetical protein
MADATLNRTHFEDAIGSAGHHLDGHGHCRKKRKKAWWEIWRR